jgi:carbon storage regulator
MLVLSRRAGEQIVIGDTIRLTVLSIRGSQVQLGFTAPPETCIYREELRLALDREGRERHSPAGSPRQQARLDA